jgi:hypothetical protein
MRGDIILASDSDNILGEVDGPDFAFDFHAVSKVYSKLSNETERVLICGRLIDGV